MNYEKFLHGTKINIYEMQLVIGELETLNQLESEKGFSNQNRTICIALASDAIQRLSKVLDLNKKNKHISFWNVISKFSMELECEYGIDEETFLRIREVSENMKNFKEAFNFSVDDQNIFESKEKITKIVFGSTDILQVAINVQDLLTDMMNIQNAR